MAVTQYTGARYVPIFADPAEWSRTKQYEPLTIVLHEGNSFTSKQFVPVGIDINDTDYWAETGNYNAQVEQYRQEVLSYEDQVDEIKDIIPVEYFSTENTVKSFVEAAFDTVPFEYNRLSYANGTNTARVYYCIIPNTYKPALRLANNTIDTTEYEIDCAYRNKSAVQINAGIFNASTGETRGVTIIDGNIEKDTPFHSTNSEHVLYMTPDGKLSAVSSENLSGTDVVNRYHPTWAVTAFSPFVENGVFIGSDEGRHPRSWIAQDANGNYFVGSCNGRKQGANGLSLQACYLVMLQIGFTPFFAMNLDGGGSTSLTTMGIRETELIASEHRKVANFISFEIDAMTNSGLFEVSHSVAENLLEIQSNMYPLYYPNYWLRLTADNDARHFGFVHVDTSGDVPTYVLDGVIQKNYDQNLMRLRVMDKEKTTLETGMEIQGATHNATIFNRYASTMNASDRPLSWAVHRPNTEYEASINLAENTLMHVGYVAMFYDSNDNLITVEFTKYNFDVSKKFPASIKGIATETNGNRHLIVVTFNTETNKISYTSTPLDGAQVLNTMQTLLMKFSI